MTVLDLNAKRAARASARGDGMSMVLGKETFQLVNEMPIDIIDLATASKFTDALRQMLADPDKDWARLLKCRPSFTDVLDVIEFFGAQMGESLRSANSSKATTRRSKPTGSGSTDETSEPTSLADLKAKKAANSPRRRSVPVGS